MDRKTLKNLVKNFSCMIISQAVYKIFTFLTIMIMARFLGPASFGQFSWGFSFVWAFLFIFDFGLSELFIRDASLNRGLISKYVNNIVTLKIFLSFFIYLLLVLLAVVTSFQSIKFWVILILGLSVMLDSFTYFFRTLFRVNDTMEYEAVLLVIEAILKFIFVWRIIVMRLNLSGVISVSLAFLVVSIVNLGLNYGAFRLNYSTFSFQQDLKLWRKLLKEAFPFAFVYLLSLYNFRVNILMLGLMQGDIITGWYSANYKLLEQIFIIPLTLSFVCLPLFSRLANSSININRLVKWLVAFLLFSGILLLTCIYFWGADLIRLIFGSNFVEGARYLFYISLVLPIFFVKPLIEKLLYIIKRQGSVLFIYICGMVLNIFLNLIVIPRWGIMGVSLTTFFTEAVVVTLISIMYIKYSNTLKTQRDLLRVSNSIIASDAGY